VAEFVQLGKRKGKSPIAGLEDYYNIIGDFASRIADSALRSVSQLQEAAKAFEDAGFTELYFDPTVASLDQVDRLADAVL